MDTINQCILMTLIRGQRITRTEARVELIHKDSNP